MDFDPERLARSPFFVGAAGSFVALRFAPGVSWWERLSNVVAGSLCAGFAAPAGMPALVMCSHSISAGMTAGVSFGVGMFGLSLAAAILQGIRETKLAEIATGWLQRRG